ncbi:uncharacterized protein LAESUDRAFT_713156 [Laetiporus sulphureus 93-53]|uniref:Uncharacterized protein n=1 Tax=Laetiporus sulphureus 93-53 TaxID=1314785 RepID=A0A165F306_9APHY|nr:uncharacterized protein LAESUDRAFT_713156 [Laetiporus sulphureus 93-53]KZT08269.1 hypothetical protein LAESUDRAFT_713156 [Laetiporus sulphureus 93-53]
MDRSTAGSNDTSAMQDDSEGRSVREEDGMKEELEDEELDYGYVLDEDDDDDGLEAAIVGDIEPEDGEDLVLDDEDDDNDIPFAALYSIESMLLLWNSLANQSLVQNYGAEVYFARDRCVHTVYARYVSGV